MSLMSDVPSTSSEMGRPVNMTYSNPNNRQPEKSNSNARIINAVTSEQVHTTNQPLITGSATGNRIIIQTGGRQSNLILNSNASSSGLPFIGSRELFDPAKELNTFWPKQMQKVENLPVAKLREAHRNQELPLARIKKIMKLDDDVKQQMVSAEAPVLLARACEMFIEELSLRSWIHTEENKRKTLQKNDISMAISKNETFDFLIDIVPRDETNKSSVKREDGSDRFSGGMGVPSSSATQSGSGEPVQYFIQMPQGGSGSTTPIGSTSGLLANGQVVQATTIGHPIQLQASGPGGGIQLLALPEGATAGAPIPLQVLSSGEDLITQHIDANVLEEEGDKRHGT